MDGIPLNSSLFRVECFSSFLRWRINSNTEHVSAEEFEQRGGGGGGGGGGGAAAAAQRGVEVRAGGAGDIPGVSGLFLDSSRPNKMLKVYNHLLKLRVKYMSISVRHCKPDPGAAVRIMAI